MKYKLFLTAISTSFLMVAGKSSYAAAANSATTPELNANSTGEEIFFTLVILILILLAFWLLKNSNLLSKTENTDEKTGRQWLDSHLKDLDAGQLQMLIKRGDAFKKNAGYPLTIENNNK